MAGVKKMSPFSERGVYAASTSNLEDAPAFNFMRREPVTLKRVGEWGSWIQDTRWPLIGNNARPGHGPRRSGIADDRRQGNRMKGTDGGYAGPSALKIFFGSGT